MNYKSPFVSEVIDHISIMLLVFLSLDIVRGFRTDTLDGHDSNQKALRDVRDNCKNDGSHGIFCVKNILACNTNIKTPNRAQ